MKFWKIFFGLALVSAAAPSAWAEGKIAIGPQGGLTFPDYHVKNTSPAAQYGNKDGWLAGLFVEFGVWTITLRPEINYVVKSYTVGNSVEVKNHFVVSPFLVLGPQWTYNRKSEVTVSGTTTSFRNTADDWDLAGVAGLGIEFNISEKIGLNLQGRYSYGFRHRDPRPQFLRPGRIVLPGRLLAARGPRES